MMKSNKWSLLYSFFFINLKAVEAQSNLLLPLLLGGIGGNSSLPFFGQNGLTNTTTDPVHSLFISNIAQRMKDNRRLIRDLEKEAVKLNEAIKDFIATNRPANPLMSSFVDPQIDFERERQRRRQFERELEFDRRNRRRDGTSELLFDAALLKRFSG